MEEEIEFVKAYVYEWSNYLDALCDALFADYLAAKELEASYSEVINEI